MTKIIYIVFLLMVSFLCNAQPNKLIACGSNMVIIISTHNLKGSIESKLIWDWSPNKAKSLPNKYKEECFNKIDECKPVKNGNEIMITSSTGGVAVIDRTTKDIIFYSYIANAHSIEELPNNRLAVVGSNNEKGNCVAVFDKDISGEKPIYKSELFAGHGLFWDNNRRLLYALGGNELITYELLDWNSEFPKIKIQKQWGLPDIGGHDLVNYNSDELLITTNNNVWLFNKVSKKIKIFEPLEGEKNIKGISINNKSIAYIQAEENWWSHNINIINPTSKILISDMNLYKVRWWKFN